MSEHEPVAGFCRVLVSRAWDEERFYKFSLLSPSLFFSSSSNCEELERIERIRRKRKEKEKEEEERRREEKKREGEKERAK